MQHEATNSLQPMELRDKSAKGTLWYSLIIASRTRNTFLFYSAAWLNLSMSISL